MLGNLNLISYQWFKSNSPFAPVRCWNHGCDFRPNFTHLSSMSEKHICDYIDRIYIYSMSTQQFLWLDVTEEVCLQILSRKSDVRDSGLAGAVRTRIIFVTFSHKWTPGKMRELFIRLQWHKYFFSLPRNSIVLLDKVSFKIGKYQCFSFDAWCLS